VCVVELDADKVGMAQIAIIQYRIEQYGFRKLHPREIGAMRNNTAGGRAHISLATCTPPAGRSTQRTTRLSIQKF
jgi:hypothetical protein